MAYSGGLTVNEGTLAYTNAAALGSGSLVLGGGTLSYAGSSSVTVSKNITLTDATSSTLANAAGNLTYSGAISGSGSIVKSGAGSLVLSGNNTGFTGSTTVNSGTLRAAAANAVGGTTAIDVNGGSFLVTAANAVNDTAAINLNGGTFAVNGTFDETVGLLTLSANSVIDLSSFTGTLRFGGVGSWADGTSLAIWNWNGINQYGTPVGDGANNRHVVFTSNSGLSNYLDRISFYSDSGSSFVGNAFEVGFSGGGTEIIAVPEPETYLAATALLLGLGIHLLRQRKRHPRLGFEKRLET
jgi:autotransporter-associated beta strand protein